MAVLAGRGAAVYLALTSSSGGASSEAMTGDATRTVYYVTNRAKRFWDPDEPITIYDDGSAVDPDDYTLYPAGGIVVFDTPRIVGHVVTSSFNYFDVAGTGAVLESREWTLNVTVDLEEDTSFNDEWKTFTPTLRGGNGTLTGNWIDEWYLSSVLRGLLGIQLAGSSGHNYYLYGRVNNNPGATEAGLVTESVDFTATGGIYYLDES